MKIRVRHIFEYYFSLFQSIGNALFLQEQVALLKESNILRTVIYIYIYIYIHEGWNFNSGNYFFTTDNKIDACFEVLLSFSVVTSIVYNPLPAMWKS